MGAVYADDAAQLAPEQKASQVATQQKQETVSSFEQYTISDRSKIVASLVALAVVGAIFWEMNWPVISAPLIGAAALASSVESSTAHPDELAPIISHDNPEQNSGNAARRAKFFAAGAVTMGLTLLKIFKS